MKIIYFTDTYKPQINGVVRSILDFERELRNRGHEVYIFFPYSSGIKKDKYHVPVPSFKFPPYPEFRAPLITFRLLKKTIKIKPDIIHVQTPASIGYAGLLIAKLLKIPVIAHYHTLIPEYFSYFLGPFEKNKTVKKISSSIIWKYTKYFYNKADLILVPTNSIKNLLKKNSIKKQIFVLPNAISGKKMKKIKHKGINILHVGRLCKEKSIDIILREFKKIEKPGINLIITSDGPDRERLEKIVKDLKLKNVKFTGFVSEKELERIYRTSDIFVSASKTETFAIVLIEAFRFGIPAIVFPALGIKDVVIDGYNGLYVKNKNDLSKKIKLLISNKNLLNRLSNGAYKSVENYFIEKVTNNLENIYFEIYKKHL
ncbi:MAG: glycosyltransferase [Candidatus Aenigmarchaeota archaeon]|nr:glycosyltransferase [Candidatus Aenigmarchaeota archaeon]